MTFRDERFHWGDDGEFDWHPAVGSTAHAKSLEDALAAERKSDARDKDWDEPKHPRDERGR